MAVYKYNGKKGADYFIDFYFNGERVREKSGTNKKDAQELLGKRLGEIKDGTYRKPQETPERPILFDEVAAEYKKQAMERRVTRRTGNTSSSSYCTISPERPSRSRRRSTLSGSRRSGRRFRQDPGNNAAVRR